MASFSFGAGNAAKLVRIPLYAAGRVATWVIPRSRNEWVFGSAVGVADGALALWQEAHRDGVRAVWLTVDERQDADAAAAGIRAVRKGSLRALWHAARARVVVITHGFGDVDRYVTAGAYIVQLWHGIPLKRIGLDSPVTVRAPHPALHPLVTVLYRRTQRSISLIPAASHLVRGRLESAFALSDERVPVTGEPRVDVLSRGTPVERRETAVARLSDLIGADAQRRLILYAPTWRDGAPDPASPTPEEWSTLHDVLAENDAVLLIRSHPLGAGDYRRGLGERVRMLGSDLVSDVTPLLPAFDALITDYSSLVFDSSLVPLPVVFLAPDAVEYAAERGFYGRYDDVTGGSQAGGWTHAIEQLNAVLGDEGERARRMDRARRLDATVHEYRDGRNARRVYDRIREQRDGGAR